MTSELTTIKMAYEEENMSPEEIAVDRDLDVGAIKAGLMQCSSKYRKDCGLEEETEDRLNFNDDELMRVNQIILDLALGAEDENLRLKAAMYVRDDKKGRRDVVQGVGGQNFNILFINEQMKKVRDMTDGIKRSILGDNQPQQKAINV
jgi:hypothetical protein